MGLQSYFGLSEHGTTVRTELVAGLTTFFAMSYIIVVNPAILSAAISIEGYSDVEVFQMLDALQPKELIPAHQNLKGLSGYVDTANAFGYEAGRDMHLSRNGNIHQITE